jgi:Ca-activated chloride channel homolog
MSHQFSLSRTGSRSRISFFAALVLAALFPLVTASAQQSVAPPAPASNQPTNNSAAPQSDAPDAESDSGAGTFKIGVNEVSLIFTVTDKHGRYIPDLKQSDFALLDNQRAPAQVTSFHQQINLPLRVGIVIDASTSIHSRFQFEQQSANEFLFDVLKAKGDRGFVMGFDVTPDITADWTNDTAKLQDGINRLKPGGGTALFDAVYSACRDKLLTTRGQEPFRKAIILLSDGDDNQSHVYLSEAIKECERAETIIDAISTECTLSRDPCDKILSQLAEETGGEVFFPPSVNEMTQSFQNIATELRSQYALNYTPADFKPDGSFRSIYLYCYDRRYQVRARKGYFAPKDQ